MDTNIFEPFTEQEFTELFYMVDPIIEKGNVFPKGDNSTDNHIRNVIWSAYQKISGNLTEKAPGCVCGSVQKYWIKALDTIAEFIMLVDKRKDTLSTESKNHTK